MEGAGQPPNYKTPVGGVTTFLNALRAKDAKLLAEATAQRAKTESSAKHQKMFTAILDESLPDNELTDLASSFAGYRIVSTNQAKSSGHLGVILEKRKARSFDMTRRTITMRKEKTGWKVMDIGPEMELANGTTPKRASAKSN
jgi:hypothetical protein